MKTYNVVNNVVVSVVNETATQSLAKKTIGGGVLDKVRFAFANKLESDYTDDAEKAAKKAVNSAIDTLSASNNPALAEYRAIVAFEEAKKAYAEAMSFRVNTVFGADVLVTDLIQATAKTDGAGFFTPAYLDKLGIYKIPSGEIIDTYQKARNFVARLYTAAYKAKMEDNKKGGLELVIHACKEAIKFNDRQWLSTKFVDMSIFRKCEFLRTILFADTLPKPMVKGDTEFFTKAQKLEVLARLGVKVNANAKDKGLAKVPDIIPIEHHKPQPFDANFYHFDAAKAKPLSKEDAARILSAPVTPLASETAAKKTAAKKTAAKKTAKAAK